MRALMSYKSENRHMTEFPARVIIPFGFSFGFVIICLANVPVYLVNGDDDYLLIEFQKGFFLALIALILGRTNIEEHRMIQDIVLIQDDI